MAAPTVPKQLEAHVFKPGQSGNPAGRAKGNRNQLGDKFLEAMLDNFTANGPETIEAVRIDKPDQYLKVIASILPRELNVKINDFDDLTDEQLARQYASIAQSLIAAGLGLSAGNASEGGAEQAGALQTIQ